jgi:hypothetical protein
LVGSLHHTIGKAEVSAATAIAFLRSRQRARCFRLAFQESACRKHFAAVAPGDEDFGTALWAAQD